MDPVRDSAWLQAAMEVPVTASLGPMAAVLRQLHSRHRRPEGVSEAEIQRLLKGLGGLCITLKDLSDQVDEPSFTVKCWMKEVRELCFDTQDYFDDVPSASGSGDTSVRPRLSTVFWKLRKLNHRLPKTQAARDFSELRARVVDASKRRKRLQLAPEISKSPETGGQAGVSHPLAPRLRTQMLEVPMDDLVKRLAFDDKEEKQLKVVTIFGFAGVGKTTAAKALYRNHAWKFLCRAFVRVSRSPDMTSLFTSILSQIKAPPPHGFPDVQDLIDIIRTHLQGKRYLIIIDDLWASSTWDIISCAFPHGDCRSRIITTTEIKDVALACCRPHLTHKYDICPLRTQQSRKLFFSIVFGSGGCCPEEFEEVSEMIISKCGGLPLVTANIASMLASERTDVVGQWKQLHDSLPCSLMTNPTYDRMKEVVNLMYNALPPYLKTCLLYLNMYPEGHVIKKEDLMKQWVVEGFIDTEETAGVYFDELVNRGMIQPLNTNCIGEVLSCTVHHMVLDLIRHKSMVENFIVIVGSLPGTAGLSDKVRRLSVQLGGAEFANVPTGFKISQVRSHAFFGFSDCVHSIEKYRLLRVLILHTWADQDKDPFDLTIIGELFRLIYLKIQCNITVQLPDEIAGLQYLETLQVDAKLSAVPSDIVHLEKLLHLRLPSECILPDGFARWTSLRTLGYFDIGNNSKDSALDLAKLTNLRDLQLTCSPVKSAEELEKNVQTLCWILEKLSVLQSVTLAPTAGCSPVNIPYMVVSRSLALFLQRIELSRHCCIFLRIPQQLDELRTLCILKIAVRRLAMNDMDILKVLLSLTALTLYVQTAPEERIVIKEGGFSVLTYFKFMCATLCLSFVQGALPNVQKLKLGFNSNKMEAQSLEAAGLHHLTGLIEISVKFGAWDADGFNRKVAESSLAVAFSNHPNALIIRVHFLDVIFGDVEYKSTATEQKEDKNLEKGFEIREGKKKITERSEEHVNKQVDIRYAKTGRHSPIGEHQAQSVDLRMGVMGSLLGKLEDDDQVNVVPKLLSFQLLKEITNGFSEDRKVGMGLYGNVYKGEPTNGEMIAVKLLHNIPGLDDKQFEEYLNIASQQHKNIVRLVGYCNETRIESIPYDGGLVLAKKTIRVLCFEYIENGSLDSFLTDESSGHDWRTCYAIISGICQGLKYLHEESNSPMYHLDLKPGNVLLDTKMSPKIADFGLSRLFGGGKTQISKSHIGTPGYIPPEYFHEGIISNKYDIFSLGVLIIKIMTGRNGYFRSAEMSPQQFMELVYADWNNKLQTTSVYALEQYSEQVKRCIEIALSCVDADRHKRPSIGEIINKLNETEIAIQFIGASVNDTGSSMNKNIPIHMKGHAKIVSVDVLPAKSWILVTHFEGPFRIWDYQKKKEIVMPHEVMREQGLKFLTAKFVEREQWIVAGGCDYCIYVFDYNTMQMVKSFKALTEQITSLAIHPKKPYVLATSYDYKIGLWDWKRDWESVEKFEVKHTGSVYQIAFNPRDDNGFASVSEDGTIKIWSVDSRSPSMTFTWNSLKKTKVRCLDYFTREKKQFLITGSDDGTAKIWDVQKTDSVKTLSGHEGESRVSTVCSHPELPLLMTGSWDGTVCLWNSNSFRLERTLKVGLGKIHALGCIEGTRRVVIGHSDGLAIVEI